MLLPGCIMISQLAFGRIFYVNKHHVSSSDENTGSLDMPWLTIGHAVSVASAGDTVYVLPGTYYESISFLHAGNSAEGPIILSGYSGEKPVIDGMGVDDSNNGILIDRSWITLRNLEVRHWGGNGIWITDAAFIEISDCVVHHVTYGIGVADGAHDFTFNRVEVHHFDLYGFDVTSSEPNVCYNGEWNDCISHDGRDPQQNVDGFALGHGNQHGFVFNRCTTYNVFDGFDISSRESLLNRCKATHCWNGCYKLWQDDVRLVNCVGCEAGIAVVELDWDGDPGVTYLTNCTFYGGDVFTIWIENKADTLEMINCILAGGENIGLAFEQMGTGAYRGDYNLFQNNNMNRFIAVGYTDEFTYESLDTGAWSAYCGQDHQSVAVTSSAAIFSGLDPFDGHLLPSSPAIDHGWPASAPPVDHEGNPRPSGSGVDIGAYEFQQITDIGAEPVQGSRSLNPKTESIFPNPFNGSTTIPYRLEGPGFVSISIYDCRARRIRTLVREVREAGDHQIVWDGCDDHGRSVTSGVYHIVMKTDRKTVSVKCTVIQ